MRSSHRAALVVVAMSSAGGLGVCLAADVELGKHLSAECVTCHRHGGQVAGGVPQIVGWREDQFIAVMKSYQDKVREHPVMQTIASRLGTEDIAALAAYFASIRKSGSTVKK